MGNRSRGTSGPSHHSKRSSTRRNGPATRGNESSAAIVGAPTIDVCGAIEGTYGDSSRRWSGVYILYLPSSAGSTSSSHLRSRSSSVVANSTAFALSSTSGRTKILHRSGTAIYNVRKKPARHFSVDTPNIVAVVKGTKFEIDESRDSSVVSVYSGIVEVTSRVDGRTVRVEPGQTAILEGGRTRLIPIETQDGSADRNVSVPAKGASSEKSDNGNRYAHGHDRNGKSGPGSKDGKENEKGNGGGKKN